MRVIANRKAVWVLVAMLFLSGCAGQKAFREGQALLAQGKNEEGLAQLQAAVTLDPDNLEYKTELLRKRAAALAQSLAEAEQARRDARYAEAEQAYRRALRIEPGNERAENGIELVRQDKRHRVELNEAEILFKEDKWPQAQAKVKGVLLENPQHAEALALQKRLDDFLNPARMIRPELKTGLSRPITLEFRDANLRSIFEVIARGAKLNFIFDKDVRPDLRATIFVRNTRIEEAIRLLLLTNQLEQRVLNDNTILIYPALPVKLNDYRELVVKSFYIANADVKQTLNMIKAILKTKDVFIDEKLNLLIMRDTPEAIRMAEKLVALQDLGEPEVMLHVEVMEVKRSRLLELGAQFPNQLSVLNQTTTATTGTVGSVASSVSQPLTLARVTDVGAGQIGVSPNPVINLRKEDSDVNLLANPKIRVKNREKAKIHIGEKVPVITTTTSVNIGVSESVNYLDVGLKLDVEPSVTLVGDVSIRVGLEVSNIVREIKGNSGTLTYQVGTRNAATVLRLRDGETQMLAGLINDEDRESANRVPGLGDLPLLGRLFSNQRNESTKTEIVLLITPYILRNVTRPVADVLEFESGTESVIGQRPFGLQGLDSASSASKPEAQSKPGPQLQQSADPAASPPSAKPALPPAPVPAVPGQAASGAARTAAPAAAGSSVIPGVLPSPPVKVAPAPPQTPVGVPVGPVTPAASAPAAG